MRPNVVMVKMIDYLSKRFAGLSGLARLGEICHLIMENGKVFMVAIIDGLKMDISMEYLKF
ncbi:hypothetical protein SDB66_13585 [Legionella pneumophila serogroup 6]|nr:MULTISPECIES: hypothetical protein [Legionella]MCW8394045.1 hypothetical protein [Legionella pneumophila]MCW8396993.1 hypothetical protein [Legionella sp. PATHC039]MCW8465520.1 hypothetical protein [Legionella pneumophila]MDW8925860.1 hypothetical protein [Legionella pneumophila]MDW8932090.1 hypothetical protein [Legionella pneumophila]